MTDLKQRILGQVGDDVKAIEAALEKNLMPHYDLVRDVAGHILFAGGKRLRPLLMVLCNRLMREPCERVIHFSTLVEYLHAATLLHDDLVDDAPLRRGKTVAHKCYGNETAILTGDFLYARALSIAAEAAQPRIVSILAEVTENMSQGEIYQLQHKGDLNLDETQYMDIIWRKTAVLFRASCHMGACLSDAPPDQRHALRDYGENLGLAFQISDDLLDYGVEAGDQLGKKTGADLREGKLTLPLILALQRSGPGDQRKIAAMVSAAQFTGAEFAWLVDTMNKCEALADTHYKATKFVGAAKYCLVPFADSAAKKLLMDIADYALARRV